MPGGSGPPTMRDVARQAGVSLKTVSRVVNGETTVAPDLAARVHAAVESLHYRPHLGASMLRRNDRRTRTIGLLLEDVSDPFSAAVNRAIEDEAYRHGVHVLTGSQDNDPARERELARAFAYRQADGMIITPAGPDQSHLRILGGGPVVFIGRAASGFPADSVLTADAAGVVGAVHHLFRRGHRRIAYLGSHTSRFRGYQAALIAAGQTPFGAYELPDEAAVARATATLLNSPDPPTSFFADTVPLTAGAIRALRRLSRHRDVALAGYGDFPSADLLEPAITVVAPDPAAIGRTAARALFERIDGFSGPPRRFEVPTTLIVRGSGEL